MGTPVASERWTRTPRPLTTWTKWTFFLRKQVFDELGSTHNMTFTFFQRPCSEFESIDLEDSLTSLIKAGNFLLPNDRGVVLVGAGYSKDVQRPYSIKPFMQNRYLPLIDENNGCFVTYSLQVEQDDVVQETRTCLYHAECAASHEFPVVRRFYRKRTLKQPKVDPLRDIHL